MRSRIRSARRLAVFLIVLALTFGGQSAWAQESPTPGETSGGGSDGNGGTNLALAVNTKDDSSVVKFAFEVRRVMNGIVDQTNAAVAAASCEDCTTIAIAIQVVLVVNDADVVTPTNLALALNVECTSCVTLASAYQWVFSTEGMVTYTPEGWAAIMDIRKQVHDLLKEEPLDILAIQSELDILMDQLGEVVTTELQPLGNPEPTPTEEPEPSATPEADPTSSAEPTGSPEAEPEPTATDEEPSPNPSA